MSCCNVTIIICEQGNKFDRSNLGTGWGNLLMTLHAAKFRPLSPARHQTCRHSTHCMKVALRQQQLAQTASGMILGAFPTASHRELRNENQTCNSQHSITCRSPRAHRITSYNIQDYHSIKIVNPDHEYLTNILTCCGHELGRIAPKCLEFRPTLNSGQKIYMRRL